MQQLNTIALLASTCKSIKNSNEKSEKRRSGGTRENNDLNRIAV